MIIRLFVKNDWFTSQKPDNSIHHYESYIQGNNSSKILATMLLFPTVSRKKATPVVALVVFMIGLGSALSLNFLVNQVRR